MNLAWNPGECGPEEGRECREECASWDGEECNCVDEYDGSDGSS